MQCAPQGSLFVCKVQIFWEWFSRHENILKLHRIPCALKLSGRNIDQSLRRGLNFCLLLFKGTVSRLITHTWHDAVNTANTFQSSPQSVPHVVVPFCYFSTSVNREFGVSGLAITRENVITHENTVCIVQTESMSIKSMWLYDETYQTVTWRRCTVVHLLISLYLSLLKNGSIK